MTEYFDTYWRYLKSLDEELEVISRFIELAQPNLSSYSIKLAQLILVVGSEIDIICKKICKKHNESLPQEKITEYQKIICKHYEWVTDLQVDIKFSDIKLSPWQSWKVNKTPEWWKAYNSIKHNRLEKYDLASLNTLLNSMAGLFTLILLLSLNDEGRCYAQHIPKMMCFGSVIKEDLLFFDKNTTCYAKE